MDNASIRPTRIATKPERRMKPGPVLLMVLAALALAGACLGALAILRPAPDAAGTCDPAHPSQELMIFGSSSSEQSPELATFAHDVAGAFVSEALACGADFSVHGVAGGGTEIALEASDFAAMRFERLPNVRARANRVRTRSEDIRAIVDAGMDEARARLGDASNSSLPALWNVVGERARPGARVVMVTDGVHVDDRVDLNRPLEEGEGSAAAEHLPVISLPPDLRVTISGIAQVDAPLPAPGATWPREVAAFNTVHCERLAAHCRVFTSATVSEALGD